MSSADHNSIRPEKVLHGLSLSQEFRIRRDSKRDQFLSLLKSIGNCRFNTLIRSNWNRALDDNHPELRQMLPDCVANRQYLTHVS